MKVMGTVYQPQPTAVGSRKQNHYVRAVLKSNKLLLIQCDMVTFKALSLLPVFPLKLKKLCTCICLYIIVTNYS